jgi:hypothetical protein
MLKYKYVGRSINYLRMLRAAGVCDFDTVDVWGVGCPPPHMCTGCSSTITGHSTNNLRAVCCAGVCDVDAIDVWGLGCPALPVHLMLH